MVWLFHALLITLSVASAISAEPDARAGLISVAVDRPPWSAIGRINNSAYGRCSAILVNPSVAVTAAHCLYNTRSNRFLQSSSIHVLFGFDRGRYGFHTTVARIIIPTEYRPSNAIASAPHDWAVLYLTTPVPNRFTPIALSIEALSPETEVQAAGFAQERSEVVTASAPCKVTGAMPSGLLFADCRISHGYSGGPLINVQTSELVGMVIAVAVSNGAGISVAIPSARLQDALKEK